VVQAAGEPARVHVPACADANIVVLVLHE
jgi:hypothetical protein